MKICKNEPAPFLWWVGGGGWGGGAVWVEILKIKLQVQIMQLGDSVPLEMT